MKYLKLILLLFSFFLSSCSQEEVEATNYIKDQVTKDALIQKKAEYFKNHKEEFYAEKEKCDKMTRQEFKKNTICRAVIIASIWY